MLKKYWEGYPDVNARMFRLMIQLSGMGLILIGLIVLIGFWTNDNRFRSWTGKDSNADGMAMPTAIGFICIGFNFIIIGSACFNSCSPTKTDRKCVEKT